MIRQARADEWLNAKTLRLEMLADTPHAFGDALDDVLLWDEARWRARHTSHVMPDSAVFVAVNDEGAWIGQMATVELRNFSPPRALLVGVYVTPAHRGDGTAADLMDAVECWALERGFDALYLDVHEQSLPAQRFYERQGFRRTGSSRPYPLDETAVEFEMVKDLTRRG